MLSVDNYVPHNYNAHYKWAEQGVMADYVIIMGYDEHWGGSEVAGSVASLGYVTEGIERMTQEVPSEKSSMQFRCIQESGRLQRTAR